MDKNFQLRMSDISGAIRQIARNSIVTNSIRKEYDFTGSKFWDSLKFGD